MKMFERTKLTNHFLIFIQFSHRCQACHRSPKTHQARSLLDAAFSWRKKNFSFFLCEEVLFGDRHFEIFYFGS